MNKSLILLAGGLFICLGSFCNPFPLTSSGTNGLTEEIRTNLYVKQGTANPILLDGDLTQYDPSFTNALDGMDARKMSNFSENLGMARSPYVLVIERRQTIATSDTIFYKMWQMQRRTYQLEFITAGMNHPGLQGFLEDNYLKTSTPVDLNGTTKADFTIDTNPASADVYRFRVIFKSIAAGALPLTLTSVKATRQNSGARIEWTTENERNVKEYAVEKSIDGSHFLVTANVKANNAPANFYSWIDSDTYLHASASNSYYRIITTEVDGKVSRSKIVQLAGGKPNYELHVFPNPVVNNSIHLEIADQLPGSYNVTLLNNYGQPVYQEKINHPGGNLIKTIRPNQALVKGVYQLEVSTTTNTKLTEKIIY